MRGSEAEDAAAPLLLQRVTLSRGEFVPALVVPPSRPVSIFPAAGALMGSTDSTSDFASVSSEEMAFALTLFVQAANRRVSAPAVSQDGLLEESQQTCDQLYRVLSADVDGQPAVRQLKTDRQTTLYAAFSSLCGHYAGDPLQAAVCARVLAFYFLMERSAGAVLVNWVEPHPDTPQLISLHPAVVDALATVRLHGSVLLPEGRFLELVAAKAAASGNEAMG